MQCDQMGCDSHPLVLPLQRDCPDRTLRTAGVRLGRPRQLDHAIANRIRAERTSSATLQAIADRLNAEGTTTPTGRSWSPTLVRKVALQDPERESVAA
jgi:hypothetical protein